MNKRKLFLVQTVENFFRFGVWIFLVLFLFFVVTLISAENYEDQTENKISYSSVYNQKTNQYYLKLNYFSENQIEKITTKSLCENSPNETLSNNFRKDTDSHINTNLCESSDMRIFEEDKFSKVNQ